MKFNFSDQKELNEYVEKLINNGELEPVCPFSQIPVEMDDECLKFEKCQKCNWFGSEWKEYKNKYA